jgi:hypothetical protein
MKKMLSLVLLIAASVTCSAQCDKKLLFSSSKTDHMENGSLLFTKEETVVLQVDRSSISLTIDGEQKGLMAITSQTCSWPVPFKEGKSTFNVSMGDDTYSLAIEGKDGKIYLTAQKDGVGNPMRMLADTFEERK